MTVARYNRLRQRLPAAELVASDGIVERARMIKDEAEISTLREAARRLSTAATEALASVAPNRTERDVAGDIDAALRRAGFTKPAFDTIVASGPNSALPHARPGARLIEAGDAVVLDFGGIYDGYCVDLTRTVQVRPAGAAFDRIFDAVEAARLAAIAAVRPGVAAASVDRAARAVLEANGLGDAFVHGTGHGLGLEVHEEPRISRHASADDVLQPGMVFTIEPGAYVPQLGGVRLEDDVLVTGTGCEVLTSVPIDRAGYGGLVTGRASDGQSSGA